MLICVFLSSGDAADDTGRFWAGIEENDPERSRVYQALDP
jgi:hypothetical protein